MLNIGFLGIAHMHGYSYIKQLKSLPEVKVIGIFDHDTKKAKKASDTFNLELFKNPRKLVEISDAVVVTSENSLHKEYSELAMKNGKHVLCEKPIATTEEDACSMLKAAKENKVIFQMAFPVRYAPSIQQAKKEIKTGKLGEILSVTATNHGRMPGGWFVDKELSGGGAVMDHTVHVVDIIRWLLDTEVTEVSAKYEKLIYDIPVEDCGLLMLNLSNDIFMSLDCSWSRPKAYPYWGDVTLYLVGTEGSLWVSAFDAKVRIFSNNNGVTWENFGDNFDQALVKEFIDSINENRDPLTTGKDGLEALRVALAAYKSKEMNETVKLIHQ
ncbi:MAG: Gfo/Idh/MocA family oxidoreductase [Kosmotoga sp.]|nr:MAG: Gfo/Idh/MocA family oxidoreductase [Kosmotoga sp.]